MPLGHSGSCFWGKAHIIGMLRGVLDGLGEAADAHDAPFPGSQKASQAQKHVFTAFSGGFSKAKRVLSVCLGLPNLMLLMRCAHARAGGGGGGGGVGRGAVQGGGAKAGERETERRRRRMKREKETKANEQEKGERTRESEKIERERDI